MGRKADRRAARLADALEREWWATAAQAWVYVGEAIRWQTDPSYRADVRAERALASTAIMMLACAPKSPDQIVNELQEVSRGPLMYPASMCDSVPFQLTVGLDAAPEITEDQVAKAISETIRRREAEQTSRRLSSK